MKATDVKKGNVIEHNNNAYQVRDIEKSSAQGRGGNVTYRFTLYSIANGSKLDLSLRADDELSELDLIRRESSFSYMDGDAFVFLDNEDYSSHTIDADQVGDLAKYISEGLTGVFVQIIDDNPIGIQLPANVVLKVIDTPPELKGGSATKRSKPATLSTGIEIQVPEYIVNGEKITVSTTTGEFGGRA
ncbi:MAG: elongation factor P-like protein YeiP [Pseudomonadales bacterium]|nr:elongation factor P-like protein YeiP [Pseudomonadales bacterium]